MPLNKEQLQKRRENIVGWLSSDEMKQYRRDFRAGNGFSVNERSRVEVSGQAVPLTEYLKREGFKDNDVIGEYRVRFNEAAGQFPENFSFFLMAPVKNVPAFSGNGNRQTEIVTWLKSSEMEDVTRTFRNSRGFSVNERARVNVGGETMPVTKFLKGEGFVDGAIVGDEYRVQVNPATEQYAENISFFLMAPVVAVPSF